MPRAARGRPNQSNAHDGKLWRDAVRVASLVVDDNDPLKRRRIVIAAEVLVLAAVAGDISALKELGDRLDGKSAQPVTNSEGGPLTVQILRLAHGVDSAT